MIGRYGPRLALCVGADRLGWPLVIHTLLIVVALAAQTTPPDYDVRAAIVGRWTADQLSMIESMPEYRSIQQEARKAFKDTFLQSMPDTTFEFRATTFTLTLGTNETIVNYRITKVQGAQLLVRTTERANTAAWSKTRSRPSSSITTR